MKALAIWDDVTEQYDYIYVQSTMEAVNVMDDFMIGSGAYSLKIGSKHCVTNCIGTIAQFYNDFQCINDCAYFMVYRDMYTALKDQKKYTV